MAAETLRPDAQLSCNNLVTCDVLEHDDDPDSVSTTIDATGNNVNTEYGINFPTPTGDPNVGADLQEFRAGVIEFDSGQAGTPKAKIELWENGSLVRAGTDTNVSVYAVLAFTWNANELATADGSLVQMKVIGSKSGGSPSSRNTIRIGHMEWNADVAAGGTTFTENHQMTAVGTPSFVRVMTGVRSFNYTSASTVSFARIISLIKAFSTTGTNVLTRISTRFKVFNTTATGTVDLSFGKLFSKAFNYTATAAVSFSKILTIVFSANYTATGSVSLARMISLTKSFTATGSVTIGKFVKMAKNMTASGTATMTDIYTSIKSFNYTATVTSTMTKIFTEASTGFKQMKTYMLSHFFHSK